MNLNLKQLKRRCQMKIEDFWSLGTTVQTKDGKYTYIDNGAPVLAVAHLDTVNNSYHFEHIRLNGKEVVFSTALDDRLGAYIILDYLPKILGTQAYDILLTEGEETGHSTATWFEASHDYNWMFQFDRAGDDVVLYQYDSEHNRSLLRKHKLIPSWGSFSDICYLDQLQCSGFNFGCGYEDNHSMYSHAEIDVTEKMIRDFISFFKEYSSFYIPVPTAKEALHRSWRVYSPNQYKGTSVKPVDTTVGSTALKNWYLDDKGHWHKYNDIGKETTAVNVPLNNYAKKSYEVGDCVNCGSYGIETDINGLCEKCADAFDIALLGQTGFNYMNCDICGVYDLCDSSGMCATCSGWCDEDANG